ncbi:MAG TPA: hypothetical protein VK806_02860 [Bacteroidia bacterium]|jgi:hypothetical protein|nr:hypothetical protein [Bacteroidia bacterium]
MENIPDNFDYYLLLVNWQRNPQKAEITTDDYHNKYGDLFLKKLIYEFRNFSKKGSELDSDTRDRIIKYLVKIQYDRYYLQGWVADELLLSADGKRKIKFYGIIEISAGVVAIYYLIEIIRILYQIACKFFLQGC